MADYEFTKKQTERIDEIYNATRDYLTVIMRKPDAQPECPYDMSIIGPVAEAVAEIMEENGERVWFPFMSEDAGGKDKIYDFYGDDYAEKHEHFEEIFDEVYEKASDKVAMITGFYKDESGNLTADIPSLNYTCNDAMIASVLQDTHPEAAFQSMVQCMYEFEMDDADEEASALVAREMEKIAPGIMKFEDLRNAVDEAVSGSIEYSLPYEHYLDSPIDIVIMVDPGENGYDFVPGPFKDLKDDIDVKNGARLCFLAEMPMRDAIKINIMMAEGKADKLKLITIGADTVCGLFRPEDGAGGDLKVQLEGPFALPVKLIHSCLPDGTQGKWSIQKAYEISASVYKPGCVTIIEK